MLQPAGVYLVIVASALVLLRMLALQSRSTLTFIVAFAGLAGGLAVQAQPRPLEALAGFTALNIALLLIAGVLLLRRVSIVAAVLLTAGPILWWIDQPRPEVFAYSLITIAIVQMAASLWWSLAAVGAASIALGPTEQISPHWPGARELLTTSFDPNVGIFTLNPFLTGAIVIALFIALTRAPRRLFTLAHGYVLFVAALFVVSSAMITNVNSGRTPGPSRYGLWLLPIAIPVLAAASATSRPLRVAAAASLLWSVVLFAPRQPENYLRPTGLARTLWHRWPTVDNPLAEVFAERVAGAEPAPLPPLATPACEKVLTVGGGSDAYWPARCASSPAPPQCREVGALCYANGRNGSYGFTEAPATLSWLRSVSERTARTGVDPIAIAADGFGGSIESVWMDAGWSYLEELPPAIGDSEPTRWRWMSDQAQVGVFTNAPSDVRFRLDTRAHGRSRRIEITVGDAHIATWEVPTTRSVFETGNFRLAPGTSLVRFDSADGADPAEGDDQRRLSITVFQFELLPAQ
jgi:hypothetical protein